MTHKIILDARFYGLEHAGLGRYLKGFIENLEPISVNREIALVINTAHLSDPSLSRFRLIVADSHPYSLISQLEMYLILTRERPELVHIPHFSIPLLYRGKIVITIHDLIKHYSKGEGTTTRSPFVYLLKRLGYKFITWIAIRRASLIFTPTKFWREHLTSKYHIDRKKILVTYEGVDTVYLKPGTKPAFKIKKPYILYVGNVYPHKNIRTLIDATKRLAGKVHLYISCARSVFWDRITQTISSSGSQELVTHLGFVPDSQLRWLHEHSLAFVTASKIEGFGLPGLEAMTSGAVVVSSNSSCLPEVYGAAALYFNPEDSEQLSNHLLALLQDPSLSRKLREKSRIWVKRYSWKKMTETITNSYEHILGITK